MAFNGLATHDDSGAMHEDISDRVAMLATDLRTPGLNLLAQPARPAERETHEWRSKSLRPVTDTLNEPGTLNDSDLTFTVDNGSRFFAGAFIVIDDEAMVVSSVAGNDVTVEARGHGDTANTTHADGATIYIRGSAALEGADPPTAQSSTYATHSNYTQIFMGPPVEVSGTRLAISTIGRNQDRYDEMIDERLAEHLRDLEWALWHGWKSATAGNDTLHRTMGGVKDYCATNVFDENGARLTQERLDTIFQTCWDNGMQNADVIVCGSFNKGLISRMPSTQIRRDPNDTTWETRIERIRNDFIDGYIIMHPNWPADEVIISTSSNLSVLPLAGRSFQHEMLAKTGDAKKGMVLGEYTLELHLEATHAWIYDTATS